MGSAKTTNKTLTRLRHKFIFTNMLFVVIVLVAVCAVVVTLNIRQRVDDVYTALERSIQTGWIVNGQELRLQDPTSGSSVTFEMPDISLSDTDDAVDGTGADDGRPDSDRTDQVVATSLCVADSDGNLLAVANGPGSLDYDTLGSAASEILQNEGITSGAEDRGLLLSLNVYYMVSQNSDGSYTLALASGSYVDQGMGTVMAVVGASAAAFLAFLIMSIFLSRWALQPVERAWNQQQQFIADASHELKTPLTVILANNSILSSDVQASVGSQMQWIESTGVEAKLMQGLVNDMLYLARSDLQQDEKILGKERVDFSDTVDNAVLQFEAVAFENGVVIEDDITPGIFVRGDSTRLLRLVSTLVDNACKYTPTGEHIKVVLVRDGSKGKLTVNNAGTPIDREDLPHLFDRFYRADKARTWGTGSYGLGLAIAQSIVADHEGTISVTSTAAEGTTFMVTLPCT